MRPGRVWAIVARDAKLLLKGGSLAAMAAAAALAGLLCVLSVPPSMFVSGSPPPVAAAFVNPDDSLYARTLFGLLGDLPEISSLDWCGPAEAEALLAGGDVAFIVEFPEDMVGALVNNRPAEIKITAADPLSGAVAYSMAAGAADTMNLMQTAVYEYRAAMPFFSGADEYAAAYGRFCAALVTDALMHSRFIETPAGAVDPYQAQLASLILFIICFGASMHAAALTARGIENGELRRLRARGVTFAQLLAAKLAGCAAVALPLCLVTSAAASAALPGLDVWRAMAASAAVTAASAPICLMISLLARKARHTAMASSAAMLLCLFTGGGFYPAYLMNLKLLNFNPAYMNAQLAAWALGGAPPEPLAYSCAALSAACVAVSAASFKMEGGGMMRLGFTRATGRAGA